MIKLYKHKSSTDKLKLYRVQGKTMTEKCLDFTIDFENGKFECNTKSIARISDEWEKSSGYTFPSSLLNEFIREAKYIDSE